MLNNIILVILYVHASIVIRYLQGNSEQSRVLEKTYSWLNSETIFLLQNFILSLIFD